MNSRKWPNGVRSVRRRKIPMFDRMKMFRFPCNGETKTISREWGACVSYRKKKIIDICINRTPYIIIRDNNYSAQQIDHDYLRWLLRYQVFYILFVFCNVNEMALERHTATTSINRYEKKKKKEKDKTETKERKKKRPK